MSSLGCWCCGSKTIEHLPYLEVVAMDAERARAFGMPAAWKVECVGQADSQRYKFGARVYRLFPSPAAWVRYCTTREASGDTVLGFPFAMDVHEEIARRLFSLLPARWFDRHSMHRSHL